MSDKYDLEPIAFHEGLAAGYIDGYTDALDAVIEGIRKETDAIGGTLLFKAIGYSDPVSSKTLRGELEIHNKDIAIAQGLRNARPLNT